MGDTILDDDQFNALRIVLVGKTGCGKSATANTILGEKKFESKLSPVSVTPKCQKAFRKWKGKNILVVDTPGLFDTKEKLDTTCREISKCVLYSSPGPHAIILVLQLNRHTEEEQKVFAMTKALFGEKVTRHMIVLFTRKEDLGGRKLGDFIAEADVSLKNLVKECGSRCCAFNNKAGEAEQEAQVKEVVELIEKMILGRGHFTDKIYEDVEERLKQKADALVKIFTTENFRRTLRTSSTYSERLCLLHHHEVDHCKVVHYWVPDIHWYSSNTNPFTSENFPPPIYSVTLPLTTT